MPTPISALIHAATMVTAGILLLLRLSIPISNNFFFILTFIAIIGSLTAFIGGTLAIISLDMKELIAYSTMSQLGWTFRLKFLILKRYKSNKNALDKVEAVESTNSTGRGKKNLYQSLGTEPSGIVKGNKTYIKILNTSVSTCLAWLGRKVP